MAGAAAAAAGVDVPAEPRIRLFLIRHGESEANLVPHLVCGQQNHIPLSAHGVAQAQALGDALCTEKVVFHVIYTSEAVRAISTATECTRRMVAAPAFHKPASELNEQGQGDWEGQPRDNVYTPQALRDMQVLAHTFRSPGTGGESLADVERRAVPFIRFITGPGSRAHHIGQSADMKGEPSVNVAVFAHCGTIRMIAHALLNADRRQAWRTDIGNTSVTEFSVCGGAFTLVRMNDHAHLRFVKPAHHHNHGHGRGHGAAADVKGAAGGHGHAPAPAAAPYAVPTDTLALYREYQRTRGNAAGALSAISADALSAKLVAYQQKALLSHPYLCVRQLKFADPRILQCPSYVALKKMTNDLSSWKLVDIGACMGADLRRAVADGFKPTNVFGVEINAGFLTLGHELYGDADSALSKNLFAFDALSLAPAPAAPARNQSPEDGAAASAAAAAHAQDAKVRDSFLSAIDAVRGVDIVYTGSVVHLLTRAQTEQLARAAFSLLTRGDADGANFGLFIGRFVCSATDQPVAFSGHGDLSYLHTVDTWAQVLREAGFKSVRVSNAGAVDMKGVTDGSGKPDEPKAFCVFEAFVGANKNALADFTPPPKPVAAAAANAPAPVSAAASAVIDSVVAASLPFHAEWRAKQRQWTGVPAGAPMTAAELGSALLAAQRDAVRSKTYRCLESMSFAVPRLLGHGVYHRLSADKQRLAATRLLDIGACMGTDLRKALIDGASIEHVFGLELNPDFVRAGATLYGDHPALKLADRFYVTDALPAASADVKDPALRAQRERLEKDMSAAGGMDAVFCSAVYHLLLKPQTEQLTAFAYRVLKARKGVFFGFTGCSALDTPLETIRPFDNSRIYLHTPASLAAMLRAAGFQTVIIHAGAGPNGSSRPNGRGGGGGGRRHGHGGPAAAAGAAGAGGDAKASAPDLHSAANPILQTPTSAASAAVIREESEGNRTTLQFEAWVDAPPAWAC